MLSTIEHCFTVVTIHKTKLANQQTDNMANNSNLHVQNVDDDITQWYLGEQRSKLVAHVNSTADELLRKLFRSRTEFTFAKAILLCHPCMTPYARPVGSRPEKSTNCRKKHPVSREKVLNRNPMSFIRHTVKLVDLMHDVLEDFTKLFVGFVTFGDAERFDAFHVACVLVVDDDETEVLKRVSFAAICTFIIILIEYFNKSIGREKCE